MSDRDRQERDRDAAAKARAMLAEIDPDLAAAVDDVDRSLIREALARTPIERLRWCEERAAEIEAMRKGKWVRR
jgi:hypothetical protein